MRGGLHAPFAGRTRADRRIGEIRARILRTASSLHRLAVLGSGRVRPSPRVRVGAAIACALGAVIAAAAARTVVFDLKPEDTPRAAARFAAARDLEVDAQAPWARIPEMLPGAHGLRLRLRPRPARRLVLYLDTREQVDGVPARLAIGVNDAPIGTVEAHAGPSSVPGVEGVRRRYRVLIAAGAVPDDPRLTIANVSGALVVWSQIRLVERRPTLTWAHLKRRGRFPPEAALLLAASLSALTIANLGVTAAGGPWRHTWALVGPGAGLVLLAAGYAAPAGSPLAAALPRWLWLLVAWLPLVFRPRPRRADVEPGVRVRRLAAGAALALGSLTVSVVGAELALRWVFRDVRTAGDTGSYFHRLRVQSNSLGFRGGEVSRSKPPGTYRLAVVGDSFTFGQVTDAELYTSLVERHLEAHRPPGRTYEVLNFGRAGADTVHEVRLLRGLVLDLDPDFVLLQWYVNDVENGDHVERPRPLALIYPVRLHWNLLARSALYSLLQVQWVALQERLGLVESHGSYMLRRFGDPDGPDSVSANERLREFIAVCRRANRPLGLVLFPRVGPDLARGAYEYGYLHDRVMEVCREEGIPCVDLRAIFAAQPDYQRLWVTPLDGHPSALAHRLAAEQLLAAFGRVWLAADRPYPAG